MKPFFLFKLLIYYFICSALIASCSKNNLQTDTLPAVPSPVVYPNSSVFASGWFSFDPAGTETGENSCSSCGPGYTQYIPQLDDNMIRSGKVLVYVRFAHVDASVVILPTAAISLEVEPQFIEISMPQENPGNTEFRYILIPPAILAKSGGVNYTDYNAVLKYFALPE